MKGFGGMNKKGRRAGGGKSGGHLFPDETGFSHAGNNGAAFAGEDEVNGFVKLVIDARGHEFQCFGLRLERVHGDCAEVSVCLFWFGLGFIS